MIAVLVPFATAAATAQLVMAVLAWQQPALPGRRALALALAAGAMFFVFRAYPILSPLLLPFVVAAPLAVNRGLRAAFETSQRPPALDAALLAILLASGLAAFTPLHVAWAATLDGTLTMLLFLELPVVVWRGLPDDLIQARRSARLWVLGLGALLGAIIAIGAAAGQGETAVSFGAAATLALCLAAAACGRRIVATLSPAEPETRAVSDPLDTRERRILQQLRTLMDDGIYRDPALTLSRLAQRLEVPEHRLRRVIHIGEGQRNFSAWLNARRIADVKARLDKGASDTILALALDAGYNSLSVFNRAFRLAEGMSPTAYRAARTASTMPTSTAAPETDSAT